MISILKIILIGIGATIMLDIWTALLKLFKAKSLDYKYVGRWIANFRKGIFVYDNILKTDSAPRELAIGWVAHYIIGTSYAFLLLLFYGSEWVENPSLMPALIIGIVTVVSPLFIMQPAFGFGFASSKLPDPNIRRLKSLSTHIVYGIGLYLTALLIDYLWK